MSTDQASATTLTCSICQQCLPRSMFSKKTVKNGQLICQTCRKRANALRVKQPPPAQLKLGRVGDSGMKRRPNNHGYCDYIDQVFGLECFSDLVSLQAFTSAKDISESMAALQAAKQHSQASPAGGQTLCLCIGDGSTPRTAVLAAFRQRNWESFISIDPMLRDDWVGKEPKGVHGLQGFKGTLLDFISTCQTPTQTFTQLVILLVHSHARFIGPCSLDKIRNLYANPQTTIVSLPCCTRFRHVQDIGQRPHIQYEDDCVFSACRTVEIWKYEQGVEANIQFCQNVE